MDAGSGLVRGYTGSKVDWAVVMEAFESRRAWLAAVEEHLSRVDTQGDAR